MAFIDYQTIKVEQQGHIAVVTLNRPDAMNAVISQMHDECEAAFLALARESSVRCVVLTGAGKAFSAGGDIKLMLERIADPQRHFRETLQLPVKAKGLLKAILQLPQPLIAAVNGDAVGLGATLALAADIVVMSEKARIGDPHVRIGLVAGDGGAVLWPALIGPAKAKELLFRGLLVKGPEAKEMGLVNHVQPVEQVLDRAMELAAELAAMPPLAMRWTKESVNKTILQNLEHIMDTSALYESLSMLSADYSEAVKAMSEKRSAVYTGE